MSLLNQSSRTSNVFKNIVGGVGGKIFSSVLSLVCRTYFISLLGATYLGVNGLFANILSMLSLAELGIGPAIVFSMYKPIAQNDEMHVAKLMNFYKQMYRMVAVIVLIIGLALVPFLDFFIKDTQGIENLTLIFVLILTNTVVSYLYSYKGAMLNADQKSYVVEIFRNLFEIIRSVAQIIVLICTNNFILYLITQMITTFMCNFVQAKYVDKKYPFLVTYKKHNIDKKEQSDIFKRVRGMMMHKFGGFILNGTDNLIISKFVGVVMVGIYSNYLMIINLIKSYIHIFSKALSASVGNLIASGDDNHSHNVFNVAVFVHFWIYSFAFIAFYVIFQPFITMWIGEEFLLSQTTLIVVLLNFYFVGFQEAVNTFTNATGLFWETRHKPIIECAVNIGFSILLASKFGIVGVFVGTLISYFATFWINPIVIYKKHFQTKPTWYFLKFVYYALITVITALCLNWICNLIPISILIVDVILRVVLCAILPNVLYILIFFKTKEFKYCVSVITSFIKRKRG